jgi:hypothetical protein
MKPKNVTREIGKDEMNLVEFPITLLSKRHETEGKTLEFTDTIIGESNKSITREWTVMGSEKFGLPLAQDNDVLLALLLIGKEKNFCSPVVNFSRYRILRIMDMETATGTNYKRIEESLDRLAGVRIKAKNAFWDNERKAYVTVNLGIFDEYRLYEGKPKRGERMQDNFPLSYVRLNNTLYQSIKAGYIKSLDAGMYFKLKSAITKRLYRYLDKKSYDGKRRFEINLFALAYVHLGFNEEVYKYASDIKKKLDSAHEELINVGFLKFAEYQKTADGSSEKIIYTFGKKVELIEGPTVKEEDTEGVPASEDELLEKLVQAGITRAVAEQIMREYGREDIMAQIKALPFRKAQDPAAILVSSILNRWNIPASCQEKAKKEKQKDAEKEQCEAEEREKAERRGTIEKYLAAQSRDEQVELIGEARELARAEGGAYFKDKEIPQYMLNAYMHMVVEKRLGL